MKVIRVVVSDLPLFEKDLDINFLTESRVMVDEKHELIRLFNDFYIGRSLTFTGLNGAGKTQVLNILSFSLKLLQAKSINESSTFSERSNDNVLNIIEGQRVRFKIYFYENKYLYKLETIITRGVDTSDGSDKYIIDSEVLQQKSIKGIRTKKEIFAFDRESNQEIKEYVRNPKDEKYLALSSDVSMVQIHYKKEELSKIFYTDLIKYTNFNFISGFWTELPAELVQFLDPSIKEIKFEIYANKNDIKVVIVFKEQDRQVVLNSIAELHSVLSSGTVKGLGVFMNAIRTLSRGGIMIIDELENHFNREIVSTIIRWFLDRTVNLNDAVLVYTTHYAELLDLLKRNDSVYIVRKTDRIEMERLSRVLKRNDTRRSEKFISGFFKNTAPSYSAESRLRNLFVSQLKEKMLEDSSE